MRRISALGVIAVALSGCSAQGLIFRADTSIKLLSPRARSVVELPTVVRWADQSAPVGAQAAPRKPNSAYYAVFVDTSPMGPGKSLYSLVTNPKQCELDLECPSASQLTGLGVYLTAKPEISLDFLNDNRPSSRSGSKDPHELTIVRMRGSHRQGEAAFRVEFFVRR